MSDLDIGERPLINAPLLRKTMDHINNEPETWRQEYWFERRGTRTRPATECATSFCFAGWAAVLDGVEAPIQAVVGDSWGVTEDKKSLSYQTFELGDNGMITKVVDHPGVTPVNNYAQKILGLTEAEADRLFDANNSLPEIKTQVSILLWRADQQERNAV